MKDKLKKIVDVTGTLFMALMFISVIPAIIYLAVDANANRKPAPAPAKKQIQVIIDKQGNELYKIITRTE
jgi:hypothetical protein